GVDVSAVLSEVFEEVAHVRGGVPALLVRSLVRVAEFLGPELETEGADDEYAEEQCDGRPGGDGTESAVDLLFHARLPCCEIGSFRVATPPRPGEEGRRETPPTPVASCTECRTLLSCAGDLWRPRGPLTQGLVDGRIAQQRRDQHRRETRPEH